MWNALQSAAVALLSQDFDLANAILDVIKSYLIFICAAFSSISLLGE